jgi:hypothetical protein
MIMKTIVRIVQRTKDFDVELSFDEFDGETTMASLTRGEQLITIPLSNQDVRLLVEGLAKYLLPGR